MSMDERVLRWIAPLSVVLMFVVCISLYFFPELHENSVLVSEEYDVVPMDAEELLTGAQAPQSVVEETNDIYAQLKIELPEEVDYSEVVIENNYLLQTIYIRIPTDATDYFSQYSVKGSCDHIEAISYYREGTKGVIAFALDKLYEVSDNCEDGNLYLNFIDPHDLYEKVIVVDAGHGGRDGGATKQGILEKNINLAILLELKEILDKSPENIGVYYTRKEDVSVTLDQRVQLANKADADLFISIHNNASNSGRYTNSTGTQVLYSESDDSEYSSERLAKICLEEVTAETGSKNKGLVKADKIYIVRTSKVPVALIEVGFMTNRTELENLNSKEYQKTAAVGIYHAIEKAFEEGY